MATTFRNPICKYGHDKRISGAAKNGNCKECARLNIWKTNPTPVPRTHCRNGHALAISGEVKGKGCRECWERTSRKENWKKYGIRNSEGSEFTHIDYDRAYQIQGGKCAICEKHQSESRNRFHVDHDHSTGAFRGLLCFNCNAALGNVKENREIVVRLGLYLKAHAGR